ncbi:sucrase-isomaltase, intestinal-like [Watersipora subatra]|uniref:sucrase-isomaltase, intestinal-like n=1 Tax=Watersipora subatra TaxID=2589382 RepID=UPI00355B4D57
MKQTSFPTFYIKHKGVNVLSIPFDSAFVYDEQFLQMTARLNSSTNYGFGEHNHKQLLLDMNYKTWSIFARDVGVVDEWNLYGVHPYFMSVNSMAKSVIGTLLLNSNAMDVHMQPAPYPSVTYRVIGGLFKFYFTIGDTPDEVTQHYTELIGRPILPPYWSLGFQLSRWGYSDTDHLKEVVRRNKEAGIPLDVVYGDIDYMLHKFAFTYDKQNFGDLPDYVKELQANHTHYVIILDPGIGIEKEKIKDINNGTYKALEEGKDMDVFIRSEDGTRLVGEVWPGLVYYPDFTNPITTTWWKSQILDFYNNTGFHFDGLWVDMNEPSNFREGNKAEEECDMESRWNSPPYIPENLLGNSLVDKTICMDSVQHWGKHYDVHSLYGHSMAISTYRALQQIFPDKRPFVLSRSTFAGTSKYAIHWLGDNQSKPGHMTWSIVGMLEFSLFGFPMTGADICGFWFNATESMCQRWTQVGAFYPFARNHNGGNYGGTTHVDQDPANFGPDMIASSRNVLLTRYKLLPYLYTLMYRASERGSTVARPLFFEFMDDDITHDIGKQFLWGPALLISPCLEEDCEKVEAYIPEGIWYDYYGGEKIESRRWHTILTPENQINLHVRGGHVIPWQHPADNTHNSKLHPYGLLVALDYKKEAIGELYIDDGESADPIERGTYDLVSFISTSGKLQIIAEYLGYKSAPNSRIDTIEIYGVERRVSGVEIDEGTITNFTVKQDEILTIKVEDSSFTYLTNHTIRWFSN